MLQTVLSQVYKLAFVIEEAVKRGWLSEEAQALLLPQAALLKCTSKGFAFDSIFSAPDVLLLLSNSNATQSKL